MTRMVVLVAVLGSVLAASAEAKYEPPARYAKGYASDALRGLVRATGGEARGAAGARYAYLRKLDGQLQELAAAQARGTGVAGAARRGGVTVADGDALVDVYVHGDVGAAADALRARGMRVDAVSRRAPQRMVEGRLPIGALTEVAGLDRVKAVVAVLGQGTDAGSVLSEGDAAHQGPQARALGADGTGVKVGVISDSIDQIGGGVSDSQATGDLPGPGSTPPGAVTVLEDDTTGPSDEGRAMAEIIFDTASGVRDMVFSSGTSAGSAGEVQSIDDLTAAGVKVIADDIFYAGEPFFQDGIVAQAADRAAAAGVTYLASAGNRARRSYQGTYSETTDPDGDPAHDMDPGAGADAVQTLGTFTNRSFQIVLQWDEPWGSAETDLAVDIWDIVGGVPSYAFSANTDNLATGLPREIANVNVSGTGTIGVSLRRIDGTRNPFMKYILIGTQGGPVEYATNSDAINPDATSAVGAISVAAVSALDPGFNTPESFSSRGPKARLFDKDGVRLAEPEVRQKPDIAAADEVMTTVPGFQPFFGTSAATPSAAGIVALMLDANPGLTPDAVRAVLRDTSHTLECTADALPRPDFDCGYGFELAPGAVQQSLDTSPPTVTPTVAGPAGANGFYIGDVDVGYAVADPDSPVYKQDGCAPVRVTTDGTATVPCAATSVGGTTAAPQTVKRDGSPPSPPVIGGLTAGPLTLASVPAQTAVGCTAADPHSGLAACAVTGYANTIGTHTLTATAVNGAGLRSTSTLTYTVTRNPFAASGLRKLGTLSRKTLKRKGVAVRFTAAAPSTRVVVTVKKGKRTLGKKTSTVSAGAKSVRVKLSKQGRKRLGRARRLSVRVAATAPGFSARTLKGTLKLKR